ncbi:histone acetylation protein-domain-containing protein [Phascolomyces articulosus]|uniref:histone acetyltransferase n=1 Tax=Phascolomyces articulosus TaxID=60185 RepID=A0AAD5PEX4_9FUNG|nr:histone acetylation protein-domain-containing protein [Phascolomyces articulosus]
MSYDTLSQHLEQLLMPLENGTQFHIYNVRTKSAPSKLFQDKRTTLQHHLILVTGINTNTVTKNYEQQDQQKQQPKFICGIETDEYETIDSNGELEKTVYIGKVDTTGTPEFNGVVGRVIEAYIKSVSPCTIHVFARSQRQYLFHQSSRNKDKRVLSDRNLLRWWYKVLTRCLEEQEQKEEKQQTASTNTTTTTENKAGIIGSWWKWLKSSSNETNKFTAPATTTTTTNVKKQTGWLSIPSVDDEQSGWYEIGQKPNSLWKYGYPYDPNAKAAQVLPRFEDDAKSRLLRTFMKDDVKRNQEADDSEGEEEGDDHDDEDEDNSEDDEDIDDSEQMTVKEFWATLGVTEECGHHLAGFFVVQLCGNNRAKDDKPMDKEILQHKEIERDEYTVLWNYFMELSFEDVNHNIESTNKFISKWKSMDLDEPLVIDTNGPTRSIITDTLPSPSSAASFSAPKQVNVLSISSIKRRVTPINVNGNGNGNVNVLSSNLIRRKRTDNDDATEQSKKPRIS